MRRCEESEKKLQNKINYLSDRGEICIYNYIKLQLNASSKEFFFLYVFLIWTAGEWQGMGGERDRGEWYTAGPLEYEEHLYEDGPFLEVPSAQWWIQLNKQKVHELPDVSATASS